MLSIYDTTTYVSKLGQPWITPEMEVFLARLNATGPSPSIALWTNFIEPGYYEDTIGCYGKYGSECYVGPRRNPCEKKFVTLDIKFVIPDSRVHLFQPLLDALFTSPGGKSRVQHKIYSIESNHHRYTGEVAMGVYKNPGFGLAFSALRKMIPTLNEEEFARYSSVEFYDSKMRGYNPDLVEVRPWTSNINCITTFPETKHYAKETGEKTVSISILSVDVEKNTEILLEILRMVL